MAHAVAETSTPPGKAAEWNWLPQLPIPYSPLFFWPPRPLRALKWFAASWLPLSDKVIFVLIAAVSWAYFQPALERCVAFDLGWIGEIYARNMVIMLLGAGGLHLYFYTFGKQGLAGKFDSHGMESDSRRFTFGDQVWDNMFWSCVSGVAVWTAFEALLMWAFANHIIAVLDWRDNIVWFVLVFLLTPVWSAAHFYVIHRLLHCPPLYRLAHALHHRNASIGPWSGISMHPIEHVMYMSSVLIFLVVPAHPVHVLFFMLFLTLGAATSHAGFQKLLIAGDRGIRLGDFFHQLHHRYFECNYGNVDMQCDHWVGSAHDGTPEATRRLRESRRKGFAG